jgi:RNA polymerase sigma factor (sigma-70 family)
MNISLTPTGESNWTPPPDHDLLSACRAGDEDAWRELIRKYSPLIFSIPLKLGIPREDATEIFQEVCLTLLSQLPRLRDDRTLPAWLIKVTVRKSSRFRRVSSRMPLDLNSDVFETAADDELPEQILVELQRESILREALSELAARCRELVRRLFFTSPPEPYEAVAKDLGLARGSIGFTRQRCLGRLRKLLEEKSFQ